MPRTLLFYTHAHGGGGAEITFDRLACAFAAAGDRVIFAVDRAGASHGPQIGGLRRVIVGPGHLGSTLRLAELLRRERPDASFSALGAQNLKHVAAAVLAGRRRRCVLGIHGFAEAEPRPLARASYRLTPLLTRMAAATICVSDALCTDMRRRWGGRRLRRIHNPVAIAPPRASGEIDANLVLALGRFERSKRFGDLVAALARLPEPLHLALLGDGPERQAIEAAAAQLGLGGRVALPGFVADPSPWYARAACVAIASETESFGLTAAEALSYGVPVVATDCGGVPEVLAGSGRIVPVGDIAALAAAIAATLANPGDPAQRLARAAAFALPVAMAAYAALADELSATGR